MSMATPGSRQARFLAKVQEKHRAEMAAELNQMAARPDYRPELAYFLDLFSAGPSPSTVAQRTGRPVTALLCLQAPLELFLAFGLHPFKIFSGSQVAGQIAAPYLPALMCPMLRAAVGALSLETETDSGCAWVLPTTCDWVVKFPEAARLSGRTIPGALHWLELPHLKDSPRGRERWFSEVRALSDFLGTMAGRKLNRTSLLDAIAVFQQARQRFTRLIELKRAGQVPLVWFLLIAGAFFLDRAENWTAAVEKALPIFDQAAPPGGRIFLAGSPICFPNFKLPHLLEEAGLTVAADDLCSSERLFPAAVAFSDPSESGLLRALAETYHQGCLCPTFADNERRVNNIWGALLGTDIKGVVFHVLKGCHPYDLESLVLEETLKARGLHFIKLETDYTAEDSQNLLTRLEAFRRTLES